MPQLASRVSHTKPSQTMALIKRAAELKAAGRSIIPLVAGEPDFSTPDSIKEAGIAAIRADHIRYTPGEGTKEIRAALAAKLKEENGLDYAPSQVIVTSGTKPLLHAAVMTIADPGDEIIIPAPYWVSYPDIVRLAGAVPVIVPCTPENGFVLQPADLAAAITPRTRGLFLNTPNNPTGAVYSAAEIKALYDVLADHPQVTVVTDEIYEHLCYDGVKPVSPAALGPEAFAKTITINGFSKGYVMMGWRLGFAAAPTALINGMADVLSHLVGAPNSISQDAALEALTGDKGYRETNRAVFARRREMALAVLNQCPGLSCTPTSGAFFVYFNCSGVIGKHTPDGKLIETDTDFVAGLIEHAGVVVVPGSAFGLSPFVRLSYSVADDVLAAGLEKIRRFCNELN